MAQAHVSGRQSQRLPFRLMGGLAVGLFVVLTALSAAQPTTTRNPKDKTTPKTTVPTPPLPLKLTIVGKDPKDQTITQTMVSSINTRLEAGWTANKVVPSRYADDYEFIRRASLDIIGRIARPSEIDEYMKDPPATRRSLLIERLLASDDYPRHWADLWTNWLLGRSGVFGHGMYHEQLKTWLEDQFAQNRPFPDIVTGLITASGKNSENGAANFILAHVGEMVPTAKRSEEGLFEMVPVTSRVTRLFLGTQVQCAQCHDHPFQSNIKQKHFWGVNAYLRQVERVGNIPMRRQDGLMTLELKDNTSVNTIAMAFYEKRNGVYEQAKAEFLPQGEEKRGKKLPTGSQGKTRREELAKAVTEHENFPKAIVNRMWGVFFGRGFINPVDDFNDQNPPSNPELFNEVSASFKNYNYDLKKLIRWICNSNAYNLSCVANATNDKPEQEVLFSRMVLKSMTPEQLFDSLSVATGAENEKTEDKKKAKDAWLDKLVANFGDDEGNEVNFNGTIVQALLMMNGNELNSAISKDRGTLKRSILKGTGPAAINELYLSTLNRKPSAAEMKSIMEKMALRPGFRDKDRADPFQDLLWALLNCNEFLLNH